MSQFEFAILGAGALGSIIGAHLGRAGRTVVMFARGSRAAQVSEHGLRIRGLASFSQSIPVLTDAVNCPGADVLIVAIKAIGTAAALEAFRSMPVGTVLSIQNGLMKNELLTAAFGADRVLGAIANTSGELLPSGDVLFTRNEMMAVGELDGGESSRARRIADALDHSGVRTRAVVDIQSLEWSKFASWAGLMLLSITTRSASWRYLTDPDGVRLVVRLVREVGVLATRCGIALTDQSALPVARVCRGSEEEAIELILAMGHQLEQRAPQHRMSSLHDLDAVRPLEIEETLGHAVRLAQQRNVALPLLEGLLPLASTIDRLNRDAILER